MKYISINELSKFNFHDAIIKKVSLSEMQLIFVVSYINASTDISQNDFGKDMCIDKANIIFDNVNVESIIFNGYKTYDSNNNLIKEVEAINVRQEEYKDILKETNEDYGYIFSMEELQQRDDGNYKACFNIEGFHVGMYNITLAFSKAIIEWDEFNGEAWYDIRIRRALYSKY